MRKRWSCISVGTAISIGDDQFADDVDAAPRTQEQTDWQVLALQPANSTLQLQSALHDPINSRLVDSEDALLYFDL